jgi:hypothetical protein
MPEPLERFSDAAMDQLRRFKKSRSFVQLLEYDRHPNASIAEKARIYMMEGERICER